MVGRQARLPLQGIRVLDFSRLLPGPWCTQFMSDLGAEVIKLERPGEGDGSRHQPPVVEDRSVYFASVNGGKKSVAIDLTSQDGRALARKLSSTCDVIIESFRPGVMDDLGLDYDTVRLANADVIYCSVSGLGQTGPLSSVSGHDLAIQCLTGLLGIDRGDGSPARMPDFQAADYAAAAISTIGILAALLRRSATGEGAFLDISMFDSLFSMSNIALLDAFTDHAGLPARPRAEIWGGNPRYTMYPTSDGKAVAVALLERRLWEDFCHMIARPDLINPSETPKDRLGAHGERGLVYRAALAEYCASRSRETVMEELTARGIPVQPVYSPSEAMALPHVEARGLLHHGEEEAAGLGPQVVNPLARAGLARPSRTPAPRLGVDTRQVLEQIGIGPQEIERLLNSQVITQ